MMMNTSLLLMNVLQTLDEIGHRKKLKKTTYRIREMESLNQYLEARLENIKHEEYTKMTNTPSSKKDPFYLINKRLHDLECKMLPPPLTEDEISLAKIKHEECAKMESISNNKKDSALSKYYRLEEESKNKEIGSTASYYELPEDSKELQDIISYLDCNAQMGEIGRAWMRYGKCSHSPKLRDINKIIFYATEEKKRILKYEQ